MTGFRWAAALLLVAIVQATGWVALPPADAHGDPTIEVVLDQIQPKLPPGVSMSVFSGEQVDVAIFNRTPYPLSVLDPIGKPFAELDSSGVTGDPSSTYLRPTVGQVSGTGSAGDCCPHGWRKLSSRGGWIWADPRLDPNLIVLPPGQGNEGRGLNALSAPPGVLAHWSIPLLYRGTTYVATGQIIRRSGLGEASAQVMRTPSGVSATVIDGTPPMLRVVPARGVDVQVLGRDGKPFLRSGPSGVVARADSPEYQANLRALRIPLGHDAGDHGWVPALTGDRFTWADWRMAYQGAYPAAATDTVVLGHWSIPLIVDGHRARISGVTTWTPITPAAQTYPATKRHVLNGPLGYLAAAGLTGLLLAVAMWSRRRGKLE